MRPIPFSRAENPQGEGLLLTSWLLVGSFVLFVNSLVMNAKIWCDVSTKLAIGAYIGVPTSTVCVLHHLYMTVSAPDSLPEKRFHQLLCKTRSYAGHACTNHCRPYHRARSAVHIH